jgi:hypothetical protein
MFPAPIIIVNGRKVRLCPVLSVIATSWGWARLRWFPPHQGPEAAGVYLEIGFPGTIRPFARWLMCSVRIQVAERSVWRDDLMFELRKLESAGDVPLFIDDFEDPWFAKEAPAVGKTLLSTTFPDGTVRDTGFFSVWRSPEGISVKLQDSESGQVWQYTAETFQKALKLVEKALQEGKRGNRSTKARIPRRKGK